MLPPPINIEGPIQVVMLPSTAKNYQDRLRADGCYLILISTEENVEGGDVLPTYGIGITDEAFARIAGP